MERGYTHIVIEASPFLRTMQTAATFAKVLGVKSIKLNCLLAKWMRSKNRSKEEKEADFNPFNHLLVAKMENTNRQVFIDKYLNGIDFYNGCSGDNLNVADSMEFDFVKHRFPETIKHVTERVKMLQKEFMSTMKKGVFDCQED